MSLARARAGKLSVDCTNDTLCGIPRSRSVNKDRNKRHKRFDFAFIHYETGMLWLGCGISRFHVQRSGCPQQ